MKCLNCGHENENYICDNCKTPEVLEKIFNDIRGYKPNECENRYLEEYANGLTEKFAVRDIIPDILAYFEFEVSEFFYCQYYRMRRDKCLENAAISYIKNIRLIQLGHKGLFKI